MYGIPFGLSLSSFSPLPLSPSSSPVIPSPPPSTVIPPPLEMSPASAMSIPMPRAFTTDEIMLRIMQDMAINTAKIKALTYQSEKLRMVSTAYTGTTYGSSFTLTAGKATKIDFVDGEHKNLKDGMIIRIPGMPLYKLKIYNRGNQSIFYDTNREEGDMDAQTELQALSEAPMIETPRPQIRSCNFVSSCSNCTIQIIAYV